MNDIVEKNRLDLGIVALHDSAPLVIAKEKGLFLKHGLEVTLSKEPSWANIRDKVSSGLLDGAHMPAGMAIANTLGIGPVKKAFSTAFSLGLNGNAVTTSHLLYESIRKYADDDTPLAQARALKRVIDARRRSGLMPLTFAHVYEYSSHNYELRYWLASGGIDPDRDVRLIVIPPVQMIENLQVGNIDAFCVGEPWNSLAEKENSGRIIVNGYDIWNNAPDKVFGVTTEWLFSYPNTHRAILKALLDSTAWLGKPENREESTEIMRHHGIEGFSSSRIPVTFDQYSSHFPWLSHAEWFITQMFRWGQIDFPVNIQRTASLVYRPELYREAAWELGVSAPCESSKKEGVHINEWSLGCNDAQIELGRDMFLDGRAFDPSLLTGYLASFDIGHLRVEEERLAIFNPASSHS